MGNSVMDITDTICTGGWYVTVSYTHLQVSGTLLSEPEEDTFLSASICNMLPQYMRQNTPTLSINSR